MSQLITVKQLAATCGVSTAWIYGRVYRGEIPFFKLGHHVRFDQGEITDWLEQQRRVPHDSTPALVTEGDQV